MNAIRARAGFTLVELVVVLAILAIMAVASAPAFATDREADPLIAAGDSVARLLDRTRVTALQGAAPVTLIIAPGSRRWWVDSPDTSGVLALPDGVGISGSRSRVRVTFDGRGGADAEPITISHGDRVAKVTVARWTGAVQVIGTAP